MSRTTLSDLAEELTGIVGKSLTNRDFAKSKFERLVGFMRASVLFRGADTGSRVCATGLVRIVQAGRLRVGSLTNFQGGMIPTELMAHAGAELSIGESCGFNYGSSFEAYQSIRIGNGCLFASMVRVCDRFGGKTAPIVIEDNVWVAHGVIIEPGVTVGRGSVLSAGSVITKDVPPDSLAIGNPARAMKLSTVVQAAG